MRSRALLAAAVVGLATGVARAEDGRILSGRPEDDIAFARGLGDKGFPELAGRALDVVGRTTGVDDPVLRADIQFAAVRAAVAEAADPIARKEALFRAMGEAKRFIEAFPRTPYADRAADWLRKACVELGSLLLEEDAPETYRAAGEPIFEFVEEQTSRHIAALRAIEEQTDEQRYELWVTEVIHPMLLLFHARLLPAGSAERRELCRRALDEFDESDLNGPGEVILAYYAAVDSALCLAELGRLDEALRRFDLPISLRESYGERDPKTGRFPIPDAAGDVVDLVGQATLQKMRVFLAAKKPADAVAAGRDWFASMPDPWAALSSMRLAKTYAELLIVAGDVKTAAALADEMVSRDPSGVGGRWGRELRDRVGGK
jgi:tetratricopeptide (TPR) repeat protein